MNSATKPAVESLGGHFDYLDGWRGLAISLLLIGHFFPVPGIPLGVLGVNFFFVLSGLLMTRLLFVQETAIDIFYRRRIARIIPTHVTFILAVVVLWLVTDSTFSTTETVAAALFLNNYVGYEPGKAVMPFGHIWSLSVEEHSYILLSLLAVAARVWRLNAMVGVGAVTLGSAICAFAYSWFFRGPELRFDQWLHTEIAGYGIFLSAFILLCLRKHPLRNYPALSVPVLIAAGVCLHWWSIPMAIQQVLGVGALALAVNLLPQSPQLLRTALAWGPLRYLGLWSFSLYVWQQPFYLWSRNGYAPTWVGLMLAFAAGLTSYYLIESPVRRYLNLNWGRRSQNAGADR